MARPEITVDHKPIRFVDLIIIVGLALAVVALAGPVVYRRMHSRPGPTVTDDQGKAALAAFYSHVKTVNSGNFQAAYDVTSSGFRFATPFDTFKQSIPALARLYGATTTDASVENEGVISSTVHARVDGHNGPGEVTAHMLYEGGAWRIDGIQLDDVKLGSSARK